MDATTQKALDAVRGIIGSRPQTDSNSAPLSSGGRQVAGGKGGLSVTAKSAGIFGADDKQAGTSLNPEAQLGLFTKIRKESSWLRFTTFAPVSEQSGTLDLWDDRDFRMKPMPTEGPRRGIPSHRPDVSHKSFSTKTMSGAFGIRLNAIRAGERAGQNVNALIQQGIAAGVANVIADLGVNGDSSLPQDGDLNIQRSTTDGWLKKMRANSSNYQSRADGFSYHNGLWAGMIQQIDKPARTNPRLAWGMTDTLGTRYLTELTATKTGATSAAQPSVINDLGAALLNTMGAQANPLGKKGVVLPQLDDDRYGSEEGYAGVAPTSVTNNGDGTLTINVNSLAGASVDRSATGADGQRYVTIGCAITGVTETLAIDYSAPNNTVTTTTLLGQTNPSTTAANYFVRWADMQSVLLAVWNQLVLVVRNGMRVYSVFYPHDEVIEVIVHIDLDYMVADYDSSVLVDDLITPRFGIFE